jgi:hypothetical protein
LEDAFPLLAIFYQKGSRARDTPNLSRPEYENVNNEKAVLPQTMQHEKVSNPKRCLSLEVPFFMSPSSKM